MTVKDRLDPQSGSHLPQAESPPLGPTEMPARGDGLYSRADDTYTAGEHELGEPRWDTFNAERQRTTDAERQTTTTSRKLIAVATVITLAIATLAYAWSRWGADNLTPSEQPPPTTQPESPRAARETQPPNEPPSPRTADRSPAASEPSYTPSAPPTAAWPDPPPVAAPPGRSVEPPLDISPNAGPRNTAAIAPASEEAVLFLQRPGVNIREAPSLTAKLVGTAPIGTRFQVTNRHDAWVEVESGRLKGWISGRFLGPEKPQ